MGEKRQREARRRLRLKLSSEKEKQEQQEVHRLSLAFIIAQFVAIFAFSTFVGLSLLHLSLRWRRYQYGDSDLLYHRTVDGLMNHYYGFEAHSTTDHVDLRVNTSIFVM